MKKPMSPAAKLYKEAFARAAHEAAVRAHLAGVKPTGLVDRTGGQGVPGASEPPRPAEPPDMIELTEAEALAALTFEDMDFEIVLQDPANDELHPAGEDRISERLKR
jgi:hypothetical protein